MYEEDTTNRKLSNLCFKSIYIELKYTTGHQMAARARNSISKQLAEGSMYHWYGLKNSCQSERGRGKATIRRVSYTSAGYLRHIQSPMQYKTWRIQSNGMLSRVALAGTDVSEKRTVSFIRVTRIGVLGTLALTSNRNTLRRKKELRGP
jgi:hypothetical protein